MSNPTISIIVPVYKVEAYLQRCVDSILTQTFSDFELILVDDGSPDNCGEICDEYAQKDSRVRVIHKENAGLSSARNAGLEIVKGKYIGFVDSDDFVEPIFLPVMSKYAIDTEADIIIGSIYWTDANTFKKQPQEPTKTRIILSENFIFELPKLLDQRRLNYVHGKLYKSKIIFENRIIFANDQLTSAEDTIFNFAVLKKSQSIVVINDYIHNYVINYTEERLANKFYFDRYERAERLQNFIELSCKEINCLSDDMQKMILKRRFLTGTWCILSAMQQKISFKKKYQFIKAVLNNDNFQKGYEISKMDFTDKSYKLMAKRNTIILMLHYCIGPRKLKVKGFIRRLIPNSFVSWYKE